jgi:hypothetical protein
MVITAPARRSSPSGGSPGVLEKGHATVVESGLVDPLAWVCEQGVVLQSARGPVPNLAEQIAGESIRGSWWGHASGHEIFAVLSGPRASGDVVATRLIDGRVTLVHRRIWPALVRVADRFPAERLAAVDDQHTASGAHRIVEVAFPAWVPPEDIAAATLLSVDEALAQLPVCLR